MTTIHLTDAQRDTFPTIVIDGEPPAMWGHDAIGHGPPPNVAPEGWRILPEPCDTCGPVRNVSDWSTFDCPDCVGGRRVVTLTATCPDCKGTKVWRVPHVDYVAHYDCPYCEDERGAATGVVTLGRFIISAMLPVVDEDYGAESYVWPDHDCLFVDNSEPDDRHAFIYTVADDMTESVRLDPLPRPGQFIAHPERVE